MLRLKAADGKFLTPEPVFSLKESVFGSAQQTPILYEEHIYGVRPNGELVCLDLDGKVLWASGMAHRFGKYGYGPYLIADGLILVLDEGGKLTLVEAGSSEFKLLAQAQVLPGNDSWGPMALAAGRLIVRDLTRMVCLDVAEPKK
jgi:outer membrane protein assembly factor BamB